MIEKKYSTKYFGDTCCLCKRKVTGAVLLCKKHWAEYSKAAKGDFKEFQKYRKKVADGLSRENYS